MTESASDQPAANAEPERKLPFQTEVSRLLHLMVHSVYSEREIFLRELVSNASDALDKLRMMALTEPGLMAGGSELAIRIMPDALKRTLTITDNGIGMDDAELAANLGTIARSGTRAFLETLGEGTAGTGLIGQFGVGFYSAFMVADEVEVVSRKAGSDVAHVWRSKGLDGFTVAPASAEQASRIRQGTAVTLFLKDDALAFMEEASIGRIIRAYSDHISFPIYLEGGEAPQQLNKASAIWTRSKQDIAADDYKEFYRHIAHQLDEPVLTIHYRAEGRSEYTVLLFVPSTRPYDLYDPGRKGRVKLYVRRVFITEDAELLPGYLRFVRGVIDSQDMPLNISREMLQKNPHVAAIQKAVTNRVLGELADLASGNAEGYAKIWEAFGPAVKEGLYEDPSRRDKLLDLARFRSTAATGSWRSLKDYVTALRPNQTAIFYVIGDSPERATASPQLEGFRARGVEVLLLSDPVDNFWVTSAVGFDGKPFRSITQGDADISAIPLLEEPKPDESGSANAAGLIDRLKRTLDTAVSEVRVSERLVSSPACIVAPSAGPDRGLEKILLRNDPMKGMAPVLEINPRHDLLKAMEKAAGSTFDDLAWLLLDQARILDGEAPGDPARFAERLNRVLVGRGAG